MTLTPEAFSKNQMRAMIAGVIATAVQFGTDPADIRSAVYEIATDDTTWQHMGLILRVASENTVIIADAMAEEQQTEPPIN